MAARSGRLVWFLAVAAGILSGATGASHPPLCVTLSSSLMASVNGDESWSRFLAEGLYVHRRRLLVIGITLIGLSMTTITEIEVDNTLQRYMVEGDPALQSYRAFQETYGNDETVLIGLRRPEGILTAEGLELLRTATERIRRIDGVVGVQSITTQVDVQPTLAGPRVRPLVPPDSLSAEQVTSLRRHIRSDSTLTRLVSQDGTMAAVIARMPPADRLDGRRGAVLDSIRHRVRPLDASVHLAGMGVILEALNEATTQDSALVLLAALAMIVGLLGVFFRRIGPVVLTVGVVCSATLWLMGLYGAAGNTVNTVTLVIPTLILVVGTADCVHLLIHASQLSDSLSGRERTIRTVAYLLFPCAVTSLTTAAGFAVLTTSAIPLVQDLGLYSAIGVIAAFVAALIGCTNAIPYALSLPHRAGNSSLEALVDRTVDTGVRHAKVILIGAGIVAGLSVLGISQLTVDTNSIGYLYPDHPVRQDSRLIEEKLGPYTPLEFVIRADSTVLRPELMRSVRQWERRVERTAAVGWHRSATDVLQRMASGVPGSNDINSSEALKSLIAVGQSRSPRLRELLDHPHQLRVTFGVPIQSAQELRSTIAAVKGAADGLPSTATVEETGYLPLYVRMTRLIVDAQVRSFGLALLVIPGMIALLFGGVWAAGWSLVPNLLPILLTLGAMGMLGIPMDIVTVTLAVIIFGLVVDDTVHLLHRYADARRSQGRGEALRIAARRAGRMMVVTTAVLAGGFLVLALAQNRSVVWFGTLVSGALVAALVTDLLIVPAILGALGQRQEGSGEEPPTPS